MSVVATMIIVVFSISYSAECESCNLTRIVWNMCNSITYCKAGMSKGRAAVSITSVMSRKQNNLHFAAVHPVAFDFPEFSQKIVCQAWARQIAEENPRKWNAEGDRYA